MDVSNFQVRVKTEELDEEYNMLPTVKEEVDEDSSVEPKIEFEYGEMCVKMEPEPERLLGPSAKVLAELQQRNLVDPEAGCRFWDEQTDVNDCRDDPEEGRSPVSNDQESGIYGEVLENGCETLTLYLNPSSPDEDDPTEFEKVFVYDMHLDKDVSEPDEQMDIDGQQHLDATNARANFRTESELAGKHPRDGDVKVHQNISDSARSKFRSLDSTGIFHIDGKIPMVILKREDCNQRALFESRESLKDKEENDRQAHSTLPLLETRTATAVAGGNTNLMNCEKTRFSSKVNLYAEKSNNKKPYPCSICDYRSTRSSYLRKHMKTHTGEKPYLCSMCDYKSSESGNLKKHMKTHTGEKPYYCSMCDYRCLHSSHLKTHMKTHTGEKPYYCSMCDYRCSQSSSLKTHMKTHTGEMPYLCSKCDYTGSQSSDIKKHMRTHTGEKPFLCSICGYCSSRFDHLKKHLKIHTGEKPYLCSTCGYKCSRLDNLKIHMTTHTGEKPYLCSKCDYRSSCSSSLKTHIKTHTGIKT